jgi:hypothetical protein
MQLARRMRPVCRSATPKGDPWDDLQQLLPLYHHLLSVTSPSSRARGRPAAHLRPVKTKRPRERNSTRLLRRLTRLLSRRHATLRCRSHQCDTCGAVLSTAFCQSCFLFFPSDIFIKIKMGAHLCKSTDLTAQPQAHYASKFSTSILLLSS